MAISLCSGSDKNFASLYNWPATHDMDGYYTVLNYASFWQSSQAEFWTYIGFHGGVNTTSGRTANTWYTDVDISNKSGILTNVLSPRNTAQTTKDLRVTIDGVVYERTIPSTDMSAANRRVCYGFSENTNTGMSNFVPDRYGMYNYPWENDSVAKLYAPRIRTNQNRTIIQPPWRVASETGLGIVFRKSLKVEQRMAHVGSTTLYRRNSCALYILT